MITLAALREANTARQAEWCPHQLPDLSFRGNELAGETGEACNVIKKLERERHGWRGSKGTVAQLAEELADVVITADLVAMQCGIDLDAAVVRKFNATSEKNELATQLVETVDLRPPVELLRRAIRMFLENNIEMPEVQRREFVVELAKFLERAGFAA